ncbi:NACHT domain-containing NTPase [Acaryochloris sp. IP29b_bin.137]|uniref:NACHT domain-containing protein n=1 Tax=Acaryochloris sp. IP29b_bin.137 TaxID=2969217 RepID=UPI0026281076|nr:NACHT domain-containing NTPase [Acaryochloris sp. IP29b_bin.137]
MAKRSLNASERGQVIAKQAFQRTGWTQAYLAEQVGLETRQSVWKFFTGRPIERHIFIDLCFQLDLDWQEIAILPQLSIPSTTVSAEQTDLEIDTWVQKVRSQLRGQVQAQCGALQSSLDINQPVLLNRVYTGVNFLSELSHQQWLEVSDLQHKSVANAENAALQPSALTSMDILQNQDKIVILGKPGAGKTTFLCHMALECNEGRYKPDCIPVFLSLRAFAAQSQESNDSTLLNYLHQLWQRCGLDIKQVKGLLDRGRVLLLLDGLDEVPAALSQMVLTQIQQFSEEFYRNQTLITCRIEAQHYHFRGFHYIELADFQQSQVEVFARRYFVATARNSKTGGLTQAAQFLRQLQQPENQALQNLTASPLLLGLICSVFQQRMSFPTKRAKLYQAGLEILLERWDQARGIQRQTEEFSLSKPETITLLCQIAATTFAEGNYYFEQRQVLNLIADYLQSVSSETVAFETLWSRSAAILKSIELQSGLLVQRAKEVYSFSHLTFQEYLTARKIIATPATLEASLDQLATQVTDSRWREVILLTASLLPNANTFVQKLWVTIKDLINANAEIRDFLREIQTKVSTLPSCEQPLPITAFYIGLLLREDPSLANRIALNFTQYLPTDLALDSALFLTVKALQKKGTQDLPPSHFLSTFLGIDNSICADPKLWQSLQDLKAQLPDESSDSETLKTWYQHQGHQWLDALQAVMVKDRGFQPQWFNGLDAQSKLKAYFGALQILVECLYGDCYVSPAMRSDIAAQLFGPNKVLTA